MKMARLSMCRICFCLNANIKNVEEDNQLQEIYERLDTRPTSDKRPLALCYICHGQLKASRRLMIKCQKAEELLTDMLNHVTDEDEDRKPLLIDRSALIQLSISSVEQLSVDSTVENIDNNVKAEVVNIYDEYLKVEENNLSETTSNIHTEHDSEQDLSLCVDGILENITKNIETAQEPEAASVGERQQHDSEEAAPNSKNTKQSHEVIKTRIINKHDSVTTENVETEKRIGATQNLDSNSKNIFTCNHCQKCYRTKKYLIRHIGTHNNENLFASNVYKKSFSRNVYLKRHSRGHTADKPRICDKCGNTFNDPAKLHKHTCVRSRKGVHICDECGQSFKHKSLLTKHKRSHTGEKPYVCEICTRRFSRNCHLKVHMRVHTGEKPHKCVSCGKSFNQKNELTKHMRVHHTGDKPYVCDVCDKCFGRSDHLRLHSRVHTGETPHVCGVCDNRFYQKCDLTKHMRTHTGVKPFACEVCDKRFAYLSNVKTHLRTHCK